MKTKASENSLSMESLASLCRRRGFIFQSSEIYGGINGFWDYGPLGCELKRNIRDLWWRDIVRERDNIVGLDAAIIMHPRVWEASGHVEGFADPMVDCRDCRRRYKADALCEEQGRSLLDHDGRMVLPEGMVCTQCGSKNLTAPRDFNLMFNTQIGPISDDSSKAYLRPETAQGIFADFSQILAVSRQKVPFGIAQIGKAFRNEINPRNYIFRSREFEQMELEYFIKPGDDVKWHEYWVAERLKWYASIGLPSESLETFTYPSNELAHYAIACVDIKYAFPFGTQELEGIAARGNYDLRRHTEYSGKSMEYFDPETNERFVPHVIEPSAGVDRVALALLCNAYAEEWIPKSDTGGERMPAEPGAKRPPDGYETRTVLRFSPNIAPVKAGVFPLVKNKPELVSKARLVYEQLRRRWNCFWDQTGAIGRRYRRQDEIGTPFGITIDFQTMEDDTVTLRDRDTMHQTRVPIEELIPRLEKTID